MQKAFENLVRVLWRYGNAGLIPTIAILLVDGKQALASIAGAIETKRSDVQTLLDDARTRKNELCPALPFSAEVTDAAQSLVAVLDALPDTRYVLLIFHPSSKISDLVVVDGEKKDMKENTPGALAWAYGTVALSSYKMPEGIDHIVPLLHQEGAVSTEDE